MNKVILSGNLGRDPDIKFNAEGQAFGTLALATSEKWKDRDTGEAKEHTEWHRVVVNGRLAEICGEYLRKGSKILVEGSNKTRSYDKDGTTVYVTEVRASKMEMLDSKGGNAGGGQQQAEIPAANRSPYAQQAAAKAPVAATEDFDDDIPF